MSAGSNCQPDGESSKQVFTVRVVFDKMVECGTTYEEGTVFKTMQRMKEPPTRPPYTCLERVGRQGFRLAEASLSISVSSWTSGSDASASGRPVLETRSTITGP